MKRTRDTDKQPQAEVADNGKHDMGRDLPASVIIRFTRHDGSVAGSAIQVPIDSTARQLEALVNSCLENEETVR